MQFYLVPYQRGDVIAVPCEYSNMSGGKVRPALVVSSDAYNHARPDVVAAGISSQVGKVGSYDHVLSDWSAAGLRYPSLGRGRLLTIEQTLIQSTVGRLTLADLLAFELKLALPLSLLGAFLALLLTGTAFDLTAMIGIIMLFGLVTKNSILLVDFANRLRRQGVPRDHAMLIAGPIRLRPVLMTSFSLILGSLPVALGLGTGGSFRQPLALVVIGGLITSTILTLLLVPTAYALLDIVQTRLSRKPKAQAAQSAPAPVAE